MEDSEEDFRGRIGGLPGDHYHSSRGDPEIDRLHSRVVVSQTCLCAHDPKVAGSNPALSTNKFKGFCGDFGPWKPFFVPAWQFLMFSMFLMCYRSLGSFPVGFRRTQRFG